MGATATNQALPSRGIHRLLVNARCHRGRINLGADAVPPTRHRRTAHGHRLLLRRRGGDHVVGVELRSAVDLGSTRMSEAPAPPSGEELPTPAVRNRRWIPRLVWVVPIAAAVIGISLLVRHWGSA